MARLRDDLDDYKLNTQFRTRPDIVSHISYRADWAHGRSRVVVEERWLPQKPALGAGSFGVVRLETRQDTDADNGAQYKDRAVKQLRKFDLARMKVDFRKELEALTKFSRSKFAQSQAFVKFLGWFEDEDHIFIAMEYFQHGTLDRFITQELGERDAQTISLQLLEGLRIMHEEQFTHRDLKPQNIFVVQQAPHWWVKIGDFGISKRVVSDGTALRTSTGTPKYLAPEIFHYVPSLDEESDSYTNAVDIWSFACVVYEMLALQVPFVDWPRNLVAFCKGGRFPDVPLIPRSSYAGIQFVKSLLVPFPAHRPTAVETLESPWLRPDTSNESRTSMILDTNRVILREYNGDHEVTIKQATATQDFATAIESSGTQKKSLDLSPRDPTANLLVSHSNRSSNSALKNQGLNIVSQGSTLSSRSSTPLLSSASEAKTGYVLQPAPKYRNSGGSFNGGKSQFSALDAIDPNWKETWGDDLKQMGITDDLIRDNQDFIAIYIRQQQAAQAEPPLVANGIENHSSPGSRPEHEYEFSDEDETIRTPHYKTPSAKSMPLVLNEKPLPQKPSTATSNKLVDAKNVSDMYHCNNCDNRLQEYWFHCGICNEGDFDLCMKCWTVGNHCNTPEHWMVKRNVKNGEITSSVIETERTLWTLCHLNGNPVSELTPPTPTLTACIINKPEPVPLKSWRSRPWNPPQRYKMRWDTCFICGKFPVEKPPHRHLSELHGTGDRMPQETGPAPLVPSSKIWMNCSSTEEVKLHRTKLEKMDHEMQAVLATKMREKEGELNRGEEELYARHREMKMQLDRQRMDLEAKKQALLSRPAPVPEKQKRKLFSLR